MHIEAIQLQETQEKAKLQIEDRKEDTIVLEQAEVRNKESGESDEIDDEEEFMYGQAMAVRMTSCDNEDQSQTGFAHQNQMVRANAPSDVSAAKRQKTGHTASAQGLAVPALTLTGSPADCGGGNLAGAPPTQGRTVFAQDIRQFNLSSEQCQCVQPPSKLKVQGKNKWTVEVAKLKPALTHLEGMYTGVIKVKDQEIKGDLTTLKRLGTEKVDKKLGCGDLAQKLRFSTMRGAIREVLEISKQLRSDCMASSLPSTVNRQPPFSLNLLCAVHRLELQGQSMSTCLFELAAQLRL